MEKTDEVAPVLPARLRRALDLVYSVEGVVGARIWQWTGRVAVGVSVGSGFVQDDTLRRVAAAVAHLRLVEEEWDFGVLDAA